MYKQNKKGDKPFVKESILILHWQIGKHSLYGVVETKWELFGKLSFLKNLLLPQIPPSFSVSLGGVIVYILFEGNMKSKAF